MNDVEHFRMTIKNHLVRMQEKLEKALGFYDQLEESVPEKEAWKICKQYNLLPSLDGLIPPDFVKPSRIIKDAMSAIGEYGIALETMTEDQLVAFVLGMGLQWIRLPYWGIDPLLDQIKKVEKAISFYKKLEDSLEESEKWKIEKEDVFVPLDELVPKDKCMPRDLLSSYLELLRSQLLILDQWKQIWK